MITCEVQDCEEASTRKGMCNKHYKRWWRHGNTSIIKQPVKSSKERWITNGYWSIKIDGKLTLEHRYLAEKALGKPLPYGVEVHHVDGDKLNNSPSNLVICPNHEYHILLHDRARAYAYRQNT